MRACVGKRDYNVSISLHMSSSPVSDEDLFLRLRNGDVAAFKTLYERYIRQLFAFVVRITRDTDEAKNILQEVFEKLWRDKGTISIKESVRGLLYTMAKNKALDLARKKNPNLPIDILSDSTEPYVTQPEMPEESELTKAIRECIEQLRKMYSKQYRSIILGGARELTDDLVAKKLQTSTVNVAQWRRRGRLKLMKCISDKAEKRGFDLPDISNF